MGCEMKDYKRLTKWSELGTLHVFDINGKEIPLCDMSPIDTDNLAGRLADLEEKIESGELDYVVDSKTEQTITDLLIEFDEMGFAPTTVCPNLEQYATEWRERVRKEFARLTAENDNFTVELEVAQRDIDNLTRTLEEANDEIKALEAENAELRATLSKMETVEKELRERLEKAVELPRIIHPNTFEWHIQYQYKSGIIDSKIKFSIEAAEACLKELKEKNND